MSILDTMNSVAFAGVFMQTNEQGTNRVLALRRGEDASWIRRGSTRRVEPAWARPIWARRHR